MTVLVNLLGFASLGILGLLLVKSLVDVDGHFDSWWYHLPYAANLAGIISPNEFRMEPVAAVRYEGFPVFQEFLQGLFWRLTGRVESANLASFGSLVAFVWFLRHFLGIRLWLSVPALLAVPLIQGQATSTYVDLSSNLAFAAFLILVYLAYIREDLINGKYFSALVLSAFVAANSKMQLIPLVAVGCMFAAYALRNRLDQILGYIDRYWVRYFLILFCLLLVFAVPLKNLILHGNPVYPIKVDILGYTLNYAENPPPKDLGGGELADAPVLKKWFYSVFEIGMGPVVSVKRWTIDSAAPEGSPLGIQGGLFGYYVIFHLLLFGCLLLLARSRGKWRISTIFIGLCMAGAAFMPASHLVRYYMYWFICLIALNLYFISRYSMGIKAVASVLFLGFMLVVIDATDQNFIRPKFLPVEEFVSNKVDPGVLEKVKMEGRSCLVFDHANKPFLYAPIWHPGSKYSVVAGPFKPEFEGEVERTCGSLPIISPR